MEGADAPGPLLRGPAELDAGPAELRGRSARDARRRGSLPQGAALPPGQGPRRQRRPGPGDRAGPRPGQPRLRLPQHRPIDGGMAGPGTTGRPALTPVTQAVLPGARSMHVRLYQDSDEPAVIALWNEVLPDSAPHNDPATAIRKKRAVQRDLFFVTTVDEGVVGTVMGGYDGHRGWVYAVAVKPQHRRQGIGGALLRPSWAGPA